jgi:hypothetical protein
VWRQFFDAWEKEFGPRLEEYVQTDEFAQRTTAFQQMNRRTAEMNEEASRQFLRAWNLPTASDFDKLSQQVADIDRRLRALSQRVDEAGPARGPRKRQGSKTPAGVKAAVESREAAKRADAASGGAGTLETEEPPSPAVAVDADTDAASDRPVVSDAGTAGVPSSKAAVTPMGTARSAQGAVDVASAGKAKTTKATPAKASKSPRSPAPSQKAKSHNKAGDTTKASDASEVVEVGVSPASGDRDRGHATERAPGNEPKGEA